MTIRFKTDTGLEFLLPDPIVVETMMNGPVFRVPHYVQVTPHGSHDGSRFGGDFRLRDAVLIEPVETQTEMELAA